MDLVRAGRLSALGQHELALALYEDAFDNLPDPAAVGFILSELGAHAVVCGCPEGDRIITRVIESVLESDRTVDAKCLFLDIFFQQFRHVVNTSPNSAALAHKYAEFVRPRLQPRIDAETPTLGAELATWLRTHVSEWPVVSVYPGLGSRSDKQA
jgi:hypothetical protein